MTMKERSELETVAQELLTMVGNLLDGAITLALQVSGLPCCDATQIIVSNALACLAADFAVKVGMPREAFVAASEQVYDHAAKAGDASGGNAN
jgi:hypothetical protein